MRRLLWALSLLLANLGEVVWLAKAQDLSSLPACMQTCVNNELGLAAQLGCSRSDTICLCENVNFGYGITDCSAQSCPSGTDLNAMIDYLNTLCSTVASSKSVSAATWSAWSSNTLTGTRTSSQSQSSTALVWGQWTSTPSGWADRSTSYTTLTSTDASGNIHTTLLSNTISTTTLQQSWAAWGPGPAGWTCYTTLFTTGTATIPISGHLGPTTYTFSSLVTDQAIFESLQLAKDSGTASAAATPGTSAGSNSATGGSALSTGAKAGIGVGVAVGVGALIGVAILLLMRSRRRRRDLTSEAKFGTTMNKAELHHQDLPRTHGRSELSEKLHAVPVELEADNAAYEVGTGTQGSRTT